MSYQSGLVLKGGLLFCASCVHEAEASFFFFFYCCLFDAFSSHSLAFNISNAAFHPNTVWPSGNIPGFKKCGQHGSVPNCSGVLDHWRLAPHGPIPIHLYVKMLSSLHITQPLCGHFERQIGTFTGSWLCASAARLSSMRTPPLCRYRTKPGMRWTQVLPRWRQSQSPPHWAF